MTYRCSVNGQETALDVEREGLRFGGRFLDYADVAALTPMNHRVWIDTLQGRRTEVSMLGFSYDGFWEELSAAFAARNLAALFVEEPHVMSSEGEFETPDDRGRGRIALYADAICILPDSEKVLRLPLCFASELTVSGYWMTVRMRSGSEISFGKMGYDSQPFFERAQKAMAQTKAERARLTAKLPSAPPFTRAGLFRTTQPELFWNAAYGAGCCAVELSAGEDAATYLYRFREPEAVFAARLEEAMEAMGPHREIIFLSDRQLAEKPLYRMAVRRCPAVRFLRERSAGRLIHNATHAARLTDFLQSKSNDAENG